MRYDEAFAEERTAVRLDPLERHYQFQLGHIQLCAGHNADALATARAVLRLGSPYANGHALAANALLNLGRYRETLDELALANDVPAAQRLAAPVEEQEAHRFLDSLGRAGADANLRHLEQLPPGSFVSPLKRATVHAAEERWPDVFRWLREGVRVHDVILKNQNCETAFDPIKSDPRYLAIMREVGLQRDSPHAR
jgi:tetratricopeptide (TPR) repeat protein